MRSIYILALIAALAGLAAGSALSSQAEKPDHVCFMQIDRDGNNEVSFEEFIPVYGEDRATFNRMDSDGNGTVSHEEYEAYRYQDKAAE